MKRNQFLLGLWLLIMANAAFAQDTIVKKKSGIVERDSAELFGGKSAVERASEEAKLAIGGYVCTYYAWYDDETTGANGFSQIPVMAPRNQQFGLNMALVTMQYNSKNVRGNLGIHFGDIATAIWPSDFNMIQEANAGMRLFKDLWLDAGLFRSHIGVESTQPRENITSSMSMVNNYEPYYLGGAKLTYFVSSKLSLQLNCFNSFNTFTDNNKDKLIGFSAVFDPNEKISMTYNFVTGDETPDNVAYKHRRYYNNFYATLKLKKFSLAIEGNYGWQDNSLLTDSTKSATIMSGLIVGRYQFVKKAALYARGEYFSDPDRVLTGTLSFGNSVMGTTVGLEFKPYKNIALSAEGRILQADNYIFKQGSFNTNQRYELIGCLDISF